MHAWFMHMYPGLFTYGQVWQLLPTFVRKHAYYPSLAVTSDMDAKCNDCTHAEAFRSLLPRPARVVTFWSYIRV